MSNFELKRWLRWCCIVILVAGLCGALLIYRFAEDLPDASLGYTVVNGTAYPLSTRDSKKYRRDVAQFGGKAALVFDDFYRWFTELWQGRTLGKTVAWISVLASLALYLFASSLPDGHDGRGSEERN